MSFKRNLVANFAGQVWIAVTSIACIPIYVQQLGVDAYGLIGFYVMLQTWFALLDFGMTPMITRETARGFASAQRSVEVADLIRSVEVVVFVIAAVLAAGLFATSGAIADHWIASRSLSVESVSSALKIIALIIAVRFCEGIYRGALFGTERQVLYNVINTLTAIVRMVGAAILVLITPSLQGFFVWQLALSVCNLAALAVAAHASLPAAERRPQFSPDALRRVGAFAGGMTLTTLFATLFTQIDKALLSRLVDLTHFGAYMLAVALVAIFPMLAGPIAAAIFPRMVAAVERDDPETEKHLFHSAGQLVSAFVTPAVVVCILVGTEAVHAWTGNSLLAQTVGPVLSLLAIGAFCNATLQIPFMLQLAHGWTTLSVKTNLIGFVILGIAVYLTAERFGITGAAAAFAATNILLLVASMVIMHRHVLRTEGAKFAVHAIIGPLLSCLTAGALVKLLAGTRPEGRLADLALVAAVAVVVTATAMLTIPTTRQYALTRLKA